MSFESLDSFVKGSTMTTNVKEKTVKSGTVKNVILKNVGGFTSIKGASSVIVLTSIQKRQI